MATQDREKVAEAPVYGKSLRLRFQYSDGKVRLLSYERLNMICPPSIGEPPLVGKSGGYWMELRDDKNRALFYRLLNWPLGQSVEVHSPEGKILRMFGPARDHVFELLLPDDPKSVAMVLAGEGLDHKLQTPSAELARFNVPQGERGGVPFGFPKSEKGDKK